MVRTPPDFFGIVMPLVPLRVDEVIELRHREGMALFAKLIHLDPVEQDKKVMGGCHLGCSLYNRFSVHGRMNKKRSDIPEFVFFVYVRSGTEYGI